MVLFHLFVVAPFAGFLQETGYASTLLRIETFPQLILPREAGFDLLACPGMVDEIVDVFDLIVQEGLRR